MTLLGLPEQAAQDVRAFHKQARAASQSLDLGLHVVAGPGDVVDHEVLDDEPDLSVELGQQPGRGQGPGPAAQEQSDQSGHG